MLSGYFNNRDLNRKASPELAVAEGAAIVAKMIASGEDLTCISEVTPQSIMQEGVSEDFNDLMLRCLQKDPFYRPRIADVLNHPFLAGAGDL